MSRTYSNLVADLPDYLENESAEYAAAVPNIILDAQRRLNRDLNVHPIRATFTGTFSGSTVTVSNDLLTIGSFTYTTSAATVAPLYLRQASFVKQYGGGSGDPEYYARVDSSSFLFAPIPASGYTYEIEGRQIITPVSSSVSSNWFTEYAYEALRAAALAESGMYTIDDRQASIVTLYEQKYQQLVAQLNGQEQTSYEVAG